MQIDDGLKQGLESVVVNIFVHIERREDVECVAEVYFPRDSNITTKDREEVCSMDDGVDVDNGHNTIAVVGEIRFDHPHAIVRVGLIEGFAELMDKCTQEGLVSNLEQEEKMDPGNI